jgi:uncharacterized phage-associated protein
MLVYSAQDIVVYFLHLLKEPVSKLKLEKLCYFSQAWYLALYNKPLIKEQFVSSTMGPSLSVLKKIENKYNLKRYIKNSATMYVLEVDYNGVVSESDMMHLDDIIHTFGDKSDIVLSDVSHRDAPWVNTERGKKMSNTGIMFYYKAIIESELSIPCNKCEKKIVYNYIVEHIHRICLRERAKRIVTDIDNMTDLLEAKKDGKIEIHWQFPDNKNGSSYFSYTATGIGIIACDKTYDGTVNEAIAMLEYKYEYLDDLNSDERGLVDAAYNLLMNSPQDFFMLLGLDTNEHLQGVKTNDIRVG